jgi:hypothetical protein
VSILDEVWLMNVSFDSRQTRSNNCCPRRVLTELDLGKKKPFDERVCEDGRTMRLIAIANGPKSSKVDLLRVSTRQWDCNHRVEMGLVDPRAGVRSAVTTAGRKVICWSGWAVASWCMERR